MNLFHSTNHMHFLNLVTYPEINIEENIFSFITGKSGSGKSTYLRLLNKTLLPSNGDIFYKGIALQDLPVISYRKEVLLVPQEVFLLDSTIQDNFLFYYKAREQNPLVLSEIEYFLHLCCLDFSPNTNCATLSGGERQRVFLSIFLSCLPRVLLLDEPTAALDVNTSSRLISQIKEFCEKKQISVICVSHNDNLIADFSDATIPLGETL